MQEKAILSYVNFHKRNIFDNTDFNFDNEYIFHIEVDKSESVYKYILHAIKQDNAMPANFWGSNISSLNVVIGKNGSGKTTLLRSITDNIGTGTTSAVGEGVIYLIHLGDKYLYFGNCLSLSLGSSIKSLEINITKGDDYIKEIYRNDSNPSVGNQNFFRNFIYFSNYFGYSYSTGNHSDFIIDISKDSCINEIVKKSNSANKIFDDFGLQKLYKKYWYGKILTLKKDRLFGDLILANHISLPNIISFNFKENSAQKKNIIDQYCLQDREKLHKNEFISHERYLTFFEDGLSVNESKLNFEISINTFITFLLDYLTKKELLPIEVLPSFLKEIVNTKDDTSSAKLADDLLKPFRNDKLNKWVMLLRFLDDSAKRFVQYWQGTDEFGFYWDDNDLELLEFLLYDHENFEFPFTCELVTDNRSGQYSAGEEAKANLFISLYDAYMRISQPTDSKKSNSILLLIDEIDAYYHPEYQIQLISDLLQIISDVFKKFHVQIIMTSNTPLEISDIPNSNLICLEQGATLPLTSKKTFGANVCTLLNSNFFLSSTMGTYAQRRINDVINFLNNNESSEINKDLAKYIISIMGEPIFKAKLEDMYFSKFPEEYDIPENKYQTSLDYMKKISDNNNYNEHEKLEAIKKELSDFRK